MRSFIHCLYFICERKFYARRHVKITWQWILDVSSIYKVHMCHFSHRRKYTACSSRDSFAYSESRHDSYPQFPRSSLGTRDLQTRSHRQKKKETTAFLESRSAKASSTNKWKYLTYYREYMNECEDLLLCFVLLGSSMMLILTDSTLGAKGFFFVIPDSSPCGLFAKKCSRIMFCLA